MTSDFEGRAALVTGGVSGIGRGIALAFADVSADVAIGDLQREPKDANVSIPTDQLVRDRGRQGTFIEANVADQLRRPYS